MSRDIPASKVVGKVSDKEFMRQLLDISKKLLQSNEANQRLEGLLIQKVQLNYFKFLDDDRCQGADTTFAVSVVTSTLASMLAILFNMVVKEDGESTGIMRTEILNGFTIMFDKTLEALRESERAGKTTH